MIQDSKIRVPGTPSLRIEFEEEIAYNYWKSDKLFFAN